LRLDEGTIERALGSVLAADARGLDGRIALRKGTLLGEPHVAALQGLTGTELHLIDLDVGEIVQDEVARRLGRAIAGPHTEASEPRQGQVRVRATARGVLRVRAAAVRAINELPTLLCFTLPDGQVVLENDEVAGAKGATLASAEQIVREAEAIAHAAGGALEVGAFIPRRVAVLLMDRLDAKGRELVDATIRRKLEWFGCDVVDVSVVSHTTEDLTDQMRAGLARGVELLLISGAGSLDPLDPAFVAIANAGGTVDRAGVPAHPGSMVWVARIREVPVLGIATCSGFGKNTSLDVLLARVLSGEDAAVAARELGHGGLLEGPTSASRFPPYGRPAVEPGRADGSRESETALEVGVP
jgi:hypothetical protein